MTLEEDAPSDPRTRVPESNPLGKVPVLVMDEFDVPDLRVDRLSAMFNPKKTTYAQVTYNDIAGFGKGAAKEVKAGMAPEAVEQVFEEKGELKPWVVAGHRWQGRMMVAAGVPLHCWGCCGVVGA